MNADAREETPRAAPAGLAAEEVSALRQAAGSDLSALARLHGEELTESDIRALREAPFAEFFALLPRRKMAEEACAVIDRGWQVLEAADVPLADALAADFAALYITHRHRASPDESVWLDEDGLQRQQPMMEVRKWYEKHGLRAPDWRKTADDNLALQLAFLAHLMAEGGEADTAPLAEAAHFLDEHLLLWIDDFAAAAAGACDTPFYAGLAIFTAAWLRTFRETLAAATGIAPLTEAEIQARRPHPAAEAAGEGPYVPGMGPAI